LHPTRFSAAKYQRRIVDAYLESLDADRAMGEIKVLVDRYGRSSEWARENRHQRRAVARHLSATEELVRSIATRFHAEARQMEKQRGAPNLDLYKRAASTYQFYLASFAGHRKAPEVRFYRAEILL